MKIILNTHKYAPEMNEAIIRGAIFPTPGLTRIRDVRRVYFSKYPFRKIVVVKVFREGQLIKTMGGTYPSFNFLKKFLKEVREYYNAGEELDIKLSSKG